MIDGGCGWWIWYCICLLLVMSEEVESLRQQLATTEE